MIRLTFNTYRYIVTPKPLHIRPSPEGEGTAKRGVRGSGLPVALDHSLILMIILAFESGLSDKP